MSDFSSVISCSIGASADFGLDSYTKTAQGVWDDQGNRTGTQVQYVLKGELFAASAAALAAALAALAAECEVEGEDFWIKNGSTVREQIAAADCAEGPRLSLKYVGEQGLRMQEVEITVDALVGISAGDGGDAGEGVVAHTYSFKRAYDVEGLLTITQSGEISTVPGTSAYQAADDEIPAEQALYQLTYEISTNLGDTKAQYSLTQRQLVSAYPVATIYDGEYTYSYELDSQNRKVMTYSYQYTGPGAAAWVEARRAQLAGLGTILRTRISVTAHKTQSAQAEFQVLASAAAPVNLLDFTETVSDGGSGPLLSEVQYAGTVPLVFAPARSAYVYEQSGQATGLQRYPLPPAMLYDSTGLMERPAITRSRKDNNEFVTTWRYRFIFAAEQTVKTPNLPAASGGFYT